MGLVIFLSLRRLRIMFDIYFAVRDGDILQEELRMNLFIFVGGGGGGIPDQM